MEHSSTIGRLNMEHSSTIGKSNMDVLKKIKDSIR